LAEHLRPAFTKSTAPLSKLTVKTASFALKAFLAITFLELDSSLMSTLLNAYGSTVF